MQALYLASVWIHILAATVWIGGMFFLVLVVVPWLRTGDRATAVAFLRDTGLRFRDVGWVCFAILIITGTFNLYVRGVSLTDFGNRDWLMSPFGRAVALKLGTFLVVLGVSAVHDFLVGPRATEVAQTAPGSPEAERLRRRASLLGRLNALLALAIVAFAVMIVRGWP